MTQAREFLEPGWAYRMRRRVDAVRTIIDYDRENIGQPLPIGRIVEIAGYSRSHFTRAFEQSEGKSHARYMLELRLRDALDQLQSGNNTVKEVAFDCGFSDASYTAKTFYRAYGIAPYELSDRILSPAQDTRHYDG
jgi:transcriptional regulator GlxA family with amidase domain